MLPCHSTLLVCSSKAPFFGDSAASVLSHRFGGDVIFFFAGVHRALKGSFDVPTSSRREAVRGKRIGDISARSDSWSERWLGGR